MAKGDGGIYGSRADIYNLARDCLLSPIAKGEGREDRLDFMMMTREVLEESKRAIEEEIERRKASNTRQFEDPEAEKKATKAREDMICPRCRCRFLAYYRPNVTQFCPPCQVFFNVLRRGRYGGGKWELATEQEKQEYINAYESRPSTIRYRATIQKFGYLVKEEAAPGDGRANRVLQVGSITGEDELSPEPDPSHPQRGEEGRDNSDETEGDGSEAWGLGRVLP